MDQESAPEHHRPDAGLGDRGDLPGDVRLQPQFLGSGDHRRAARYSAALQMVEILAYRRPLEEKNGLYQKPRSRLHEFKRQIQSVKDAPNVWFGGIATGASFAICSPQSVASAASAKRFCESASVSRPDRHLCDLASTATRGSLSNRRIELN
jgi:hypothetical protein